MVARRPFVISTLLVTLTLLCGVGESRGQADARTHPSRPGLLVIESARDTSGTFQWVVLPSLGGRCLIWDGGVLVLPNAVTGDSFGVADFTIPYTQDLLGVSEGRRLLFRDGRYGIRHPVMLTDGTIHLFLSEGDILIESGRIVVRRGGSQTDPRAQYLLLAGLVLLISILWARARSRLRRS